MKICEETLPLKLRSDQMSRKWDERFLGVARLISDWSKDPSTKVGAIAVNLNRRILAQGYNGFPSGAHDDSVLYTDRLTKYSRIVHAESNIIYNACNFQVSLNLSTICVFGMYPCPECSKALAQVGVARIIFQVGNSENFSKWKDDFEVSKKILRELGIGYTHYIEDK
jgi:dCMP deaminase